MAIGSLLREWRAARRLSQLDLALRAEISARHLNRVENGKSQPTVEMIKRLADALDIPLRERNTMLVAAGYAAQYSETELDAPKMTLVRQAIEFILAQQEPYPAFITDVYWNVLMTNDALKRLFGWIRDGADIHDNILRQIFDPHDMRPFIHNWDEVAEDCVKLLHDQVAAAPSDTKARALLDEVLAYPGVPDRWRKRDLSTAPVPMLTCEFHKGDIVMRFFSTITTFATPRDVTIEGLRIECLYPVDDVTANICRTLASNGGIEP
ncbi:MAG TPA: helix-turn-helix transcriptional regulator [Gemmatimonadaceae bacterium]|nr:helix-turn-helix transcriptional regulator [Gemmatimonadaceae bacterium]